MRIENNARVRVVRGHVGWLSVLILATAGVVHSPITAAEFYVRNDHLGRKHVSNLSPHGFTRNGEIRSAYDPNSIVYQHAKMLETLAAESAALAQAREQQAHDSDNKIIALQPRPTRRAPREGAMNLDELIDLEKRGGRWQGEVEGQP